MRVLCGHANWYLEIVVNLVNVLIPHTPMEEAVYPVEVEVLDEEGGHRSDHNSRPARQFGVHTNSKVRRQEMEQEHHGELEHDMTHHQTLQTLDVVLKRHGFALLEDTT